MCMESSSRSSEGNGHCCSASGCDGCRMDSRRGAGATIQQPKERQSGSEKASLKKMNLIQFFTSFFTRLVGTLKKILSNSSRLMPPRF